MSFTRKLHASDNELPMTIQNDTDYNSTMGLGESPTSANEAMAQCRGADSMPLHKTCGSDKVWFKSQLGSYNHSASRKFCNGQLPALSRVQIPCFKDLIQSALWLWRRPVVIFWTQNGELLQFDGESFGIITPPPAARLTNVLRICFEDALAITTQPTSPPAAQPTTQPTTQPTRPPTSTSLPTTQSTTASASLPGGTQSTVAQPATKPKTQPTTKHAAQPAATPRTKRTTSRPLTGTTKAMAGTSQTQRPNAVTPGAITSSRAPRAMPASIAKRSYTQRITYGNSSTLVCDATGDTPMNLVWWKGNHKLTQGTGPHLSLVLQGVEADVGLYTCTASNKAGSDSMTVGITMEVQENGNTESSGSNLSNSMLWPYMVSCCHG
ncbi:mucin-2-like [Sycon ciliatum]|uniref:mucin-2-like n=1 Tax=Sycon ciliatum TaxID=27933 RepID=UPI0031F6CFB4